MAQPDTTRLRHPSPGEHDLPAQWLSVRQLHELAERAGLPVPPWGTANTPHEAIRVAEGIGFPVALKADSGALVHKSDAGGVHLGLDSRSDVTRSFENVQAITGLAESPVLVQHMSAPGVELMASSWIDDVFGPVVMVGSGGRLVEILQDTQVWVGALSLDDAHRLLENLRCYPLLTGYRGSEPADLDALAHAITAIAKIAGTSYGDGVVKQFEVNPLIANTESAVAVDMRATIVPAESEEAQRQDPTVPEFGRLFEPRSIAVVGASRRETMPTRILRHLQDFGYDGEISVVNHSAATDGTEIQGIKPVAAINELPDEVDYGLVAVPAAHITETVRELGARAAFVQVLTSGFGESGDVGSRRELELRTAAQNTGTRLLGPNCLGLHSTPGRVTFVDNMRPRDGSVDLISQSGGLAADILRQGQARGVAFRRAVTIGNAADLGAEDFLEGFLNDDRSSVVGLYLEGTTDGARLLKLLHRARTRGKRVVLMHGGRSDTGARAVASHTGALSGADQLWTAMAAQSGVTYVDQLDQFVTALAGVSMLRTARTGRVLLVGPSGGMSALATDQADRLGLELAEFGHRALAALSQLDVPPGTSLGNPIDTPAGALAIDGGALVPQIVRAATCEPHTIDQVIVHLDAQTALSYTSAGPDILRNVASAVATLHAEFAERNETPEVALALRTNGEPEIQSLCLEILESVWDRGVPAFLSLEDALAAVRYSLTVNA